MQEANNSNTLLDKKYITLEFASSYDGKEAVAKAANYLFKKNYLGGDQKELTFKESDIDEALKVIGSFDLFPPFSLFHDTPYFLSKSIWCVVIC